MRGYTAPEEEDQNEKILLDLKDLCKKKAKYSERGTERQRDSETEGQRDRGTERQRDRETDTVRE